MYKATIKTVESFSRKLPDAEKEALSAILKARPQLLTFIEKNAHLTLAQYGESAIDSATCLSPVIQKILVEKIQRYFSSTDVGLEIENLAHTSSMDTSGHGGIFSEDTLVQSHAVISKGFFHSSSPAFVSLACGVVPMNNATWPRGFFVMGARESLFPKSFDRVAFHECPAFTREMVEKKLKDAALNKRSRALFEFIHSIPDIYEQKMYYEQTMLINHLLWERALVLPGKTPSFFQLLLEDVTASLLTESIRAEDSLSKLVFCREKQPLFFEMLAHLPGTWSVDRSKGTYLFWQASGDFRAASLWLEDGKLQNSSYGIPYTPDAILEALEARTIVPSVFLSLVTLLHNGVRPLGGYHQLWYLPEYRKRILEFFSIEQNIACPQFLSHIQYVDLFHLGYGFSFFRDPKDSAVLAGIDTFMQFPESRKSFWDAMHHTSVASGLVENLKRLYAEIVPATLRTIKW